MAEFLSSWILTAVIAVPLVGALVVGLTRPQKSNGSHPNRCEMDASAAGRVEWVALLGSVVTLALAGFALVLFVQASDLSGNLAAQGKYALCLDAAWVIDAEAIDHRSMDLRYHVGVDGLSIWLVLLTAGIMPLCIWGSFSGIRNRVKEYYVLMLVLESGMIGVFCARDLLMFYIFFEFTLVPLFFLIGIWGGTERRRAATKFFVYTVAGSVLTFAGVLFLAYRASLPITQGGVGRFTFDLDTLYGLNLEPGVQWWLFLAFAAGFAIKVPLFPFHTWLPLAHTEAPTAGSVLLAGILLKLGTYGFLRLSLPMLPQASMLFAPAMAVLAIVGIIYAALVAWVQEDIKKLVAYSSVSHLGFCMLGMFSMTTAGLTGSLLYMVNHGLSTGALFFVVGMIYERYHTREFRKIGGLARPMPWMAFFLMVFTLSSIGLPGLNGFVSEFLVLLGTFTSDAAYGRSYTGDSMAPAGPLGFTYAIFAATGIVLSAVYMLSMCQRVLFGPLREPKGTPDPSAGLTADLTKREIGILAPIALVCLLLGVWPKPVIDVIQPAAEKQILARVYGESSEAISSPEGFVERTVEPLAAATLSPERASKRDDISRHTQDVPHTIQTATGSSVDKPRSRLDAVAEVIP